MPELKLEKRERKAMKLLNCYSRDEIASLVDLVVETIAPEKIILFGSYAYGNPTGNSDVDLLVVMPEKRLTFEQVSELGAKVFMKHFDRPRYIKNDLCIISQEDFDELRDNQISAVYDAVRKGEVLYAQSN